MEIRVISPERIVFTGKCKNAIFPGEYGVFEVMPFHKKLMSILIDGDIDVDGQLFPISRGVVRVNENIITAVVEEEKKERIS